MGLNPWILFRYSFQTVSSPGLMYLLNVAGSLRIFDAVSNLGFVPSRSSLKLDILDGVGGVNVSDKFSMKEYVRLCLHVFKAVVFAVKVLALYELPHDSELQAFDLAVRRMEATAVIFLYDAVRIDEVPYPVRQDVRRSWGLGSFPKPFHVAGRSVPSKKKNSFVVPSVGIYPRYKLTPNCRHVISLHNARMSGAQSMDPVQILVPDCVLSQVDVFVECCWLPPNI